jgi:SAM-dependent methyltransferase
VTVVQNTSQTETQFDPFAAPAPGPVPRRPRVLSYLGRWGRARRWLSPQALRVLDVGCAFGYGAAAVVARGPAGRVVVGVERDPEHLEMAARRFPWLRILDADAAELPVPDGCADAVLLLDVMEHVAEPERVLAEAHRVLRPRGTLIVSVPHDGPLRGLDALNLYEGLRRRRPSLPPLEAATGSDSGTHNHYAVGELEALLSPWFTVHRVARTGLGLQELVTIALLVIRIPLRAPGVARALLPAHLLAYLLDDLIPSGPLAYHVAVAAWRKDPADAR